MIQVIANTIARKFQKREEAKFHPTVILKINRVIQLNRYSCGLQSAFVILNYYGKINSINEIQYDRNLLKKDGIDTEPLLNVIRMNGVRIKVNDKANLDDIKKALQDSKPILISIDEGEHWIVIYGFSNERIFVLDSAVTSSIKCAWTYEEFMERWDENWIAVFEL